MVKFILVNLQIGLAAIRANQLRSALTALGIIVGVAAVILTLAIGSGASQELARQIASIGSNIILVLPGTATSSGVRLGLGSGRSLTVQDALAIRQRCPSVVRVSPFWGSAVQVIYRRANWTTALNGCWPEMFPIRNWQLFSGRFFSEAEVRSGAKVAVLGMTVVRELFGAEDPLGKIIRINRIPFKVIGILEEKGASPRGDDQDDRIYVPISMAQRRILGPKIPGQVQAILVQARSLELLSQAQKEIASVLRQTHRLSPEAEDDFTIRNLSEMLSLAQRSANLMALLMGSIALISLVVGGIGIMNIMLVSVTERTREIGIRMAVGARPRDILGQFLLESVALCLVGGTVGIVLGIVGAELLRLFTGWPIYISWWAVILAALFSSAVGLFFGLYPARKAAYLDPIKALRYE
ncbi:ABC transporter permease [Thermosulfuriphilus sp.]